MSDAGPDTNAPSPVLVGVTTYLDRAVHGDWDESYGMVQEAYLRGVLDGGGVPVLLPPQPASDAVIARVLGAVDALVLTGGADVDPARYGAARDPRTEPGQPHRDEWELALLAGALARDLPVLAICRGVQVLNTGLGGTLIQHVPDVTRADHGRTAGVYARTEVEVEGGALVAALLGGVGTRLTVHCHHHQALGDVAEPLTVAARSADRLVEAVELRGGAFTIGVQWHPEEDPADRRLFAGLVAAARR